LSTPGNATAAEVRDLAPSFSDANITPKSLTDNAIQSLTYARFRRLAARCRIDRTQEGRLAMTNS
jgi:hypothetical protein